MNQAIIQIKLKVKWIRIWYAESSNPFETKKIPRFLVFIIESLFKLFQSEW